MLSRWFPLLAAAIFLAVPPVLAEDTDPCGRFKWGVSHERTVMKQTPQAIVAAASADSGVARLEIDTLYGVSLTGQKEVRFVEPPGRAARDEAPRGGILRFRVERAGRYRVSISSSHWLDVLEDSQVIKSHDFNGQPGCERPHKIVEFDLPASRDLWLQLSGVGQSPVLLAITFVEPVAEAAEHR